MIMSVQGRTRIANSGGANHGGGPTNPDTPSIQVNWIYSFVWFYLYEYILHLVCKGPQGVADAGKGQSSPVVFFISFCSQISFGG